MGSKEIQEFALQRKVAAGLSGEMRQIENRKRIVNCDGMNAVSHRVAGVIRIGRIDLCRSASACDFLEIPN